MIENIRKMVGKYAVYLLNILLELSGKNNRLQIVSSILKENEGKRFSNSYFGFPHEWEKAPNAYMAYF